MKKYPRLQYYSLFLMARLLPLAAALGRTGIGSLALNEQGDPPWLIACAGVSSFVVFWAMLSGYSVGLDKATNPKPVRENSVHTTEELTEVAVDTSSAETSTDELPNNKKPYCSLFFGTVFSTSFAASEAILSFLGTRTLANFFLSESIGTQYIAPVAFAGASFYSYYRMMAPVTRNFLHKPRSILMLKGRDPDATLPRDGWYYSSLALGILTALFSAIGLGFLATFGVLRLIDTTQNSLSPRETLIIALLATGISVAISGLLFFINSNFDLAYTISDKLNSARTFIKSQHKADIPKWVAAIFVTGFFGYATFALISVASEASIEAIMNGIKNSENGSFSDLARTLISTFVYIISSCITFTATAVNSREGTEFLLSSYRSDPFRCTLWSDFYEGHGERSASRQVRPVPSTTPSSPS